MDIRIKVLMLIALVLAPMWASAQDEVAWPCDGCSNQQMKNVALQKGLGTQYVYNISAGLLVGYEVTNEDLYFGKWTKVAMPFQPEDWIIDQFAGMYDYYVGNNGSFTGITTASTQSVNGGQVNGYDVVESSLDRNRVADAIASNPRMAFTSAMASFGRVIRLGGVVTPDTPLTVNVFFPNGSSVTYRFSWDTKRWEYMPKSARYSHGNSIPETTSDFTNDGAGACFDFSGPGNPNDVNDFLRRAASAGVTISGGTRWACTIAGGGVARCLPY